jgi:RNA polymerase sigma-70 factor (ECF subfamily)
VSAAAAEPSLPKPVSELRSAVNWARPAAPGAGRLVVESVRDGASEAPADHAQANAVLAANGAPRPARSEAADAARDQRLERLLAECARGDRAAFADLYRATSGMLFAVAVRLLRRRDQAEEILQDCYLSIWNNAGIYSRARSAPLTWMIAIVRNRCFDVLRRSPVEVALEADENGEDLLEKLEADEPNPLERLCAVADADAIARCLALLGSEQRQAIVLAFYEGLSRWELAARLGRPVGTVKTWIRRGLERLRACLEET